ncbi:MAG: hypothetical protein Q4E54_03090, partial [Lachnospiraceae bacterium]|nr:hypothetical protein [Lachnospiraceae bacterium]
MKKIVSIIIIAAMVMSASACAKKDTAEPAAAEPAAEAVLEPAAETPAETSADTVTEAVKEEEPVGLANPMVGITDPAEFENQLGIAIDPAQIVYDTKLFIINKDLAHIAWTQKNVNDEDVDFTLRATKNAELGPNCHGIQGELTKLNDIEIQGAQGPVTITVSEQGGYTVYTWKVGDTYYSLTYNNDM